MVCCIEYSEYKTSANEQIILVDIGYNFTQCSYIELSNSGDNSVEQFQSINQWPGVEDKDATQIETATQHINNDSASTQTKTCFNKVLSFAKQDLKVFMIDFLTMIHKHTCEYLKKISPTTNIEKYRYCITMENSFKFFNDKKFMQEIAIEAGIINENEDDRNRLLLINRENAAALHFEDLYFAEHRKRQAVFKDDLLFSSTFLQIQFNSDICHLTLYEATKIMGKYDEDSTKQYPRNVRCIRSTTFETNFFDNVIEKLDQFITEYDNHFRCNANKHSHSYFKVNEVVLKRQFANYIKVILFTNTEILELNSWDRLIWTIVSTL